MKCTLCNNPEDLILETSTENFSIWEEVEMYEIEVLTDKYRCELCGELYQTEEQIDYALNELCKAMSIKENN